jgi:hypothetical protein
MDDLYLQLRFGVKIMEGLACIAGFWVWARLKPAFWKSFPVYLLIIVCCEFAGWYMNKHGIFKPAKFMYSYFVIPLEFLYMQLLFFKILPNSFRKTVVGISLMYIVAFFAEQFFLKNSKWLWLSGSYSIGCVTLFILCTIYFLYLHQSEKSILVKKEPFFWICLGLVLFYVGTFPYYSMPKNLDQFNEKLYYIFIWLLVILNYIMYFLFIIGFLCFRKTGK